MYPLSASLFHIIIFGGLTNLTSFAPKYEFSEKKYKHGVYFNLMDYCIQLYTPPPLRISLRITQMALQDCFDRFMDDLSVFLLTTRGKFG